MGWANRLILGDSLLVMNSLLVKEGMAGKVQMIYVDPPYGIKYASNFQPRTDHRDVKDKDEDLTHEPEQIKAYCDTWTLGIHSYLTYLRDRLLLARELLAESGSIFVQINDENLHLVRCLMDEVFGRENCCGLIAFRKTGGFSTKLLPLVYDWLLWYARQRDVIKFRPLFTQKRSMTVEEQYDLIEEPNGTIRKAISDELGGLSSLPPGARRLMDDNLMSQGETADRFEVAYRGRSYQPGVGYHWKTTRLGVQRLVLADRLMPVGNWLKYKRYLDDHPVAMLDNIWSDVVPSTFSDSKVYVVQTTTKVIERCILMTTDPDDLVFDPTCGPGTTAYCAEKWGRRWMTCNTSRVALAIARQRLMTARYDYYDLADAPRGPAGGFFYETVPHITLESIAHNMEIDAIAAKYQPQIDQALADINAHVRPAGESVRARHAGELVGARHAVPLREWEIPREFPAEWPAAAREAFDRFGALKRRKRQEIDASIQRNAPQETLYDRPRIRRGVVRVSGPFTVEAIPVPAVEDPSQAPIPQFEEAVGADLVSAQEGHVSDRDGDYLATKLNLLKQQGSVLFLGGRKMELRNLRALNVGYLHAEAETPQDGKSARVALSFGPQYGPVTAYQVQEAIPTAKMNGYALLIVAGFTIDPEAQALIQKAPVPGLQVQFAHIAPDVLVGDLLKTGRASQIFTVSGQPDVRLEKQSDGTYRAELLGVDIYDPLSGETSHARGDDVAAWFLDSDYDGMTFHICQAFFPGDEEAWDKLQRALKAQIAPEAF